MTRPLRRRHARILGAVALVVAPLCVAALAVRPRPALLPELPPAVAEPEAGADGRQLELASSPPIRVRRPPGGGALVLEAPEPVEEAGMLLYWLPESARFPDGALLLGAVRGHGRQVIALPPAAAQPGSLVLYGLGHGEELARTPWQGGEGP